MFFSYDMTMILGDTIMANICITKVEAQLPMPKSRDLEQMLKVVYQTRWQTWIYTRDLRLLCMLLKKVWYFRSTNMLPIK